MEQKIQCYSGVSGSGKTSTLLKLSKKLQDQGIKVGGIATIGDFKNGVRSSFWVIDVTNPQQHIPLASRNAKTNITIGCFGFFSEGILWGNNCILNAMKQNVTVLFIDEIGPLELSGKGWHSSLSQLKDYFIPHIIFTSRPSTLEAIQQTFFCHKEIETIEI